MENTPRNNKSLSTLLNNSWFWVGSLVIIVAVGAYLDLRPNPQSPVGKTTISRGTIKQMTAKAQISQDGFSPEVLIIKPNTEVTWTNTDGQPHKIAADPYPADNSISGFSTTQLLQKGDSYSFRFEKTGVYHVHDELNPLKITGTVKVEN